MRGGLLGLSVLVLPACSALLGIDDFKTGAVNQDASPAETLVTDAPPDATPDAPSQIPPGATLWLRFDDDPADGAADSAGAHVGACTSCPTLIAAGKIGGAYDFAMNQIDVTPAADFAPPPGGFTVAVWMRLDTTPMGQPYATVVAKWAAAMGSAPSYALFVNSAGQAEFYTDPGSGLVGGNLTLGAWHHVAISWDGNLKRLYLNGVQVGMIPNGMPNNTLTNPLLIGRYYPMANGLEFDGAIDEVLFYPRALNDAEVMQLATMN